MHSNGFKNLFLVLLHAHVGPLFGMHFQFTNDINIFVYHAISNKFVSKYIYLALVRLKTSSNTDHAPSNIYEKALIMQKRSPLCTFVTYRGK